MSFLSKRRKAYVIPAGAIIVVVVVIIGVLVYGFTGTDGSGGFLRPAQDTRVYAYRMPDGSVIEARVDEADKLNLDEQGATLTRCGNAPSLISMRETDNLIVKGQIGTVSVERSYQPDYNEFAFMEPLRYDTEIVDRLEDLKALAMFSRTLNVEGKMWLTEDQYRNRYVELGNIRYASPDKSFEFMFPNIVSNFNCENLPSAGDYYRPKGARYYTELVLRDKETNEIIDRACRIFYVKYGAEYENMEGRVTDCLNKIL